jgi:hypothetical protein
VDLTPRAYRLTGSNAHPRICNIRRDDPINHEEAYSRDGACTNQAESFFSRMRRAEIGVHHHIAGLYLRRYAADMSWREDMRATDNSRLTSEVAALTMNRGHSVDWRGYWRRWQHAA